MKRGDIYFANLDPTIGSKIRIQEPTAGRIKDEIMIRVDAALKLHLDLN